MKRQSIRHFEAKLLDRRRRPVAGLLAFGIFLAAATMPLSGAAGSGVSGPQPGLAMHGEPDLKAGFSHFPYVNPSAPKGGKLTLGFPGTFDTLNPFNLKAGSAAHGISGNIYQTLMTRSLDEPFSVYALIAKSIETDAARSWVIFRLDPRARFSDGKPVTSRDVKFSVELLGKQGRPQHRAAFRLIKSVQTPDEHTVRFDLAGANDRELPLILALMPVLPAHATNVERFANSSLDKPLGSGPYILRQVEPGDALQFVRDKNYWAKDLPTQRGLYNFDEIRIEYYRDGASLFQAFQAGLTDYFEEGNPTRWRTAYDFPALRQGRVIKATLPVGGAKGMVGFAFNTRRALFADVHVREAISAMFDFEWINANIFGGLYKRTRSFFDNSDLSASGRPATANEKALLAKWPGAVRADIMNGTYKVPVSDGTGRDRAPARFALGLLKQAGFRLENGRLVDGRSGKPFGFELLVSDREQERLALLYAQSLRRIGITVDVRQVDQVQYQRRRQKFDFDMIMGWWIASNSPGNEQRNRWSSTSADIESSFNLAGVKSPAIDGLIGKMLGAQLRDDFETAVRAYDRVLQSGFYIVPLFHKPDIWITHSNKLAFPRPLPRYASPLFSETLETWWRKSP